MTDRQEIAGLFLFDPQIYRQDVAINDILFKEIIVTNNQRKDAHICLTKAPALSNL